MASPFTPLHTHSHYSLLRALPKIPDLVQAAKEAGCEALALTDLDNLYGAIEFYRECTSAGIKPILGADISLEGGRRVVLLAENEQGYKNLLSLITDTHKEDAAGAPLLRTALSEYAEGLIALLPWREGEVMTALRAGDEAHAGKIYGEYCFLFGEKNVYLAAANYEEGAENPLLSSLKAFAERHRARVAAAHESFYLVPEDRRAFETLCAIGNRGPVDEGAIGEEDDDLSFLSSERMRTCFASWPEALAATNEIAKRCTLTLSLGSWVFPNFSIPKDSDYDRELRVLVEKGLMARGMEKTPEVEKRLEYELGIIKDKGYSPYFLVVADLLAFARGNGILTTIRGSVAGSLVTYVTGITTVNPLAYNIPFERFLNPERPSAPDIDMDYADNRRDEVIEYARHKYGDSHVAQIGTFGTMLARGVVRDVARALGYPYGVGDRIAKAVPMGSQGFPMTLERALTENPELAEMYKKERDVREIIDLGKKIEGCARHISVHAAGVVIAPRPLSEYTPLQKDPKGGKLITQYDMYSIESAGLLKFDFLGIRNLSILANAVEIVEATRGVSIDIENVPLDDQKTFEMLARGETEGLFQLNGSGMTRFLKELRPTTINDINAMVALYRPGPMEMIPAYIERKHNPALISYLDPRMEEYLRPSYGLLVYQDDVLLTAIKLAGYSWLEADALRKAMGKKIPEEMQAQKKKFIDGAVEHGMEPARAERLWKLIEPFAAYGFGKAHAASYGKVAYQTSYMKANFPVEYMAAVLTAEAGDIETVGIMVAECKRLGIPVLPPDVNASFGDFTVILGKSAGTKEARELAEGTNEDAIRFGLYSIKNFGRGVADAIIEERERGGRFKTLSGFLSRVKEQTLNKKSLEALIQCGALDSLGERGQMLVHIDRLLEFHREAGKEQSQDSLFSGLPQSAGELELPPTPEALMADKLAWEKELLGLYVSGHPLDRVRDKLARHPMNIRRMREEVRPGMTAVAAGIIEDVRTVLTRGGDQMAFIKLSDLSGSIEAVVFPKSFSAYRDILKPESVVALKGRLSNRNGELSLVAEALKAL